MAVTPEFEALQGDSHESVGSPLENAPRDVTRESAVERAAPKVEGDRRGASWPLVVIALSVAIFILDWAQSFFVTVTLAAFIAFALNPLVTSLTRVVRSRGLAAAVVVSAGVMILLGMTQSLSNDFMQIVESLPTAARKAATSIKESRGAEPTPVQQVQRAAQELRAAAEGEETISRSAREPLRVKVDPQPVPLWEYIWTGSRHAANAVGQVAAGVLLIFFFLASGDLFKRKLLRLQGISTSYRRVTVSLLEEISGQITRYIWVLICANILVGIGTWIAFSAVGLNNPLAWGVAAAVLHTIPYFGPAVIAGSAGIVAFLQFESWTQAALVAGLEIIIATIVGMVLATWMAARTMKMNATATFVGLLFWGWLWGGWGLLLGIPIVVAVKAICERSVRLKPVAELLG